MPLKSTVLLLASAALMGGCASFATDSVDGALFKPKIILSEDNFSVVRKHVSGQASCRYLLWIAIPEWIQLAAGMPKPIPIISIAIDDPSLREQAMADLHRMHDLRGKPQILHNLMEEWTVAGYVGFYAVVRLTITAEVLEFAERKAQ